MKVCSIIFTVLVTAMMPILTVKATAQQNVAACTDKLIHTELVMLDKELEDRGFNLVQFQTMNMPSGAYLPVTLQMDAGQMYQINFIANKEFKEYSLTLIDKDRQKLVDRKMKQKSGAKHHISESFVAPYSGNYVIVLTQKLKGVKEACAGFSVLEATAPAKPGKK